jgi:tubulin polyglutamylase TTLL6/13
MCFEVLGIDIFLDWKLKPYLLEVNHTPSFTTDTPLDSMIKKNLIRDTLRLMNINTKTKYDLLNYRRELMQ